MRKTPFKVFCLSAGSWDWSYNKPVKSPLVVGNEYTVVSVMNDQHGAYYSLAEISKADFYAELFAILPDQSADEMQEQEREDIVNLERV